MAELVKPDRAEALENQPMLAIESNPVSAGLCVRARNLSPELVASMRGRVESVLRVNVAATGVADDNELPDISGDYEILGDGVRFSPHFPFDCGVLFRAILDLRAIERPGLADVQSSEFSFPREIGALDTEVCQVFPSNDGVAGEPASPLRLFFQSDAARPS
jgi:hypothetical protein